MDNTQKIILVVAVVTLLVAIIFFFCTGKSKNNSENLTEPEQEEAAPTQAEQPKQVLPPRQGKPQSSGVLVMFFAPWCGHCKNMAPAWEELAQNFDGYNGVKIVKVNGQEQAQLAQLHGVGGFPTIKYCPGGLDSPDGVVYQGDRSVASLAQFLQQHA